ncbi:hypothetical protein ACH0BF_24145 [Pseudobacillus sp. 179-B 2D1 NHS]
MKEEKDQVKHGNSTNKEEEVQFVKEIDLEALNVIKQLYDKTLRELVNR